MMFHRDPYQDLENRRMADPMDSVASDYVTLDWPQSFLFLCYIYLAFLHFFHLPL